MGIHYEPEPPTTEEEWARLEEQAAKHLATVPERDRLIVRDGLKTSIAIGRAIVAHGLIIVKHCSCGREHRPCEPAQAVRIARTILHSVFSRGAENTESLLGMIEAESVRPTAARAIVDATAHYYNVLPAVILGDSSRKLATRARHVAIWLCAKHCREMSLPDLGAFFGRDHTTIYAARIKIEAELKVDSSLPLVMRAIEAML